MADKEAEKVQAEAEKKQEKVEKKEERPPRGDDPAPQVALEDEVEVVRGPSVERTVAPGPWGELNTLDPRNSRDPAVRAAAAEAVNVELARAQVESSDAELSVKLKASEAAELVRAASGPGHSADSAVRKLEDALNAEVSKKLK